MTETRTRRAREDSVAVLTLPQFLRVATEAEIVAAGCDEAAARILEPQHGEQVSAMARGLAAVFTKAAQDTREFMNLTRVASPASSANGYGGA